MFSNIGPVALVLILVLAFMIYGPSKLPEMGKSLGETIRSFKGGVEKKESVSDESKGDANENGSK